MVEMNRIIISDKEVLSICLFLPRFVLRFYIYGTYIFSSYWIPIHEDYVRFIHIENKVVKRYSSCLEETGIKEGMTMDEVLDLLS